MAGTLSPNPYFTGLDDNGDPISGGLLYTYLAGTSTPEATYTDVNLSVANANPVVLDSAGRCTLFLSPTSYKFILKTSAGVTVRMQDDISAVPATNVDLDITGTAGETLAAGEVVYLSDGSGAKTAGKWYLADADNTYSSTIAKVVGFAVNAYSADESALIRIQGRITGLSGLTAGTTYYISATAGALTSSAPANARAVLVADSTTSGVLSFWLSVQDASATSAGIVNLTTQTLGAGTKTVDALTVTGATTMNLPGTFKPGTSADADAIISGRLTSNTTAVGNVGGGEDTLMSYTLKASALSANGKAVRVLAGGSYAANANNKTWNVYFGATSITMRNAADNSASARWWAEVWIFRTGAATQFMVTRFHNTTISGAEMSSASPAETLSGAVLIKFTGTATANDDIIQDWMSIEVVG